jgi:L-seryl-tRNA(Ser) seleniumtransferase
MSLSSLPSIEKLINEDASSYLVEEYSRELTADAYRSVLDEARQDYREGIPLPEVDQIFERAREILASWTASTLNPVINATGVILHTNLGRSPLSEATIEAMRSAASGYSNLEFDLQTGKRGSRLIHCEVILEKVTGAQAGLVVNNNASAVLLAITGLAKRRKVVIARSQLVEIGGGFRVPDVMKQSGAKLLEVGTTNRVHISDYSDTLVEKPALFMRAHRSNFQIVGFTGEPELREISGVGREAGVPILDDIGSGALLDTAEFGLGHEPMVQESLEQGADLVCFSGDKLLGGPQAGIIVGESKLIAKLKNHPLARAVRADKVCLAGLSATLSHYLKGEAVEKVPVWRMISMPLAAISSRAREWSEQIGRGDVLEGISAVGGGSLPGETLPTWVLAIDHAHPDTFMRRLRELEYPVIARLENDRVLFDPRTVLAGQDKNLVAGISEALDQE